MSKALDIVNALKKEKKLEVSILSSDDSPCTVDEWIPTGCSALDAIMGGGLPLGRLTEIYGDPSSGKSLIAAQIAAVAQDSGMLVAYADSETAVSKEMMKMLGVDVDTLIYMSPDTIEDVFTFFDNTIDMVERLDPENMLLCIWDSVAATSSEAEMAKEFG